MNFGKTPTKSIKSTSKLPKSATSTHSSTSSTPKITTLSPPSSVVSSGITLNCLVHGEPIYCYFTIIARNNDTLVSLKELITKGTDLGGITTRLLGLWVVSVPFDSNNFGDSNVDIANTLNGQRFLPQNVVGDYFTTPPAEGHVQIIIESPTSADDRKVEILRQAFETITTNMNQAFNNMSQVFIDTTRQNTEATRQHTEATRQLSVVTRQLSKTMERQTIKPTVPLSKIKQTELNELLDVFQLPIDAIDLNVDSTDDVTVQPFLWDERNEDQHADDVVNPETNVKKEGYINYLKKNIRISNESDFYDTKSKKSLLSLKYDMLPFEISGTTDVVIAKKSHANALALAKGIQAGFELAKVIQDSHVPQAIGQLFTANIRSNEAVFIVLTDLNDTWIFFWLENREDKVQSRVGQCEAISIIERTFGSADSPLNLQQPYHNFREYLRVGGAEGPEIPEAERPETERSEGKERENDGLELFLNRSKINLEFEDDVANMKDVYDVMTEEEICNWKINRVLRLLSETPEFQAFQSENDHSRPPL